MIHYVLQILIFQLLFLLAFDLFLKRETFFQCNRWYLLLTSLFSMLLPFVEIAFLREQVAPQYALQLPQVLIGAELEAASISLPAVEFGTQAIWQQVTLANSVLVLWALGSTVMAALFIYKLIRLNALRNAHPKKRLHTITVVLLPRTRSAFSFFKCIFLGDSLSEEQQQTILAHERVHVRQWHSLDLLYFEVLRILFWFNPLIYLYRNRLVAQHEFIADAHGAATQRASYYQGLLSQVFQTEGISFTNSFFNHSLIKKRIVMMQKSKSRKIVQLKYLILLPLFLAMLTYTSCSQDTDVGGETSLSEKIADLERALENADTITEAQAHSLKRLGERVSVSGTPKNVDVGVPFAVMDKIPTYPGCEDLSGEEAKKCMSQKIATFIIENFDTKVTKASKLEGRQRVAVQFAITDQGLVTDVQARAPSAELEREAKRVVSSLPQMLPGEKDGKKVKVIYSLPLIIAMDR